VVQAFMMKISRGDPAQVWIQESEQPLTSSLIAVPPVRQPHCDVPRTRQFSCPSVLPDTRGPAAFPNPRANPGPIIKMTRSGNILVQDGALEAVDVQK
jgi:hypothetical protein